MSRDWACALRMMASMARVVVSARCASARKSRSRAKSVAFWMAMAAWSANRRQIASSSSVKARDTVLLI